MADRQQPERPAANGESSENPLLDLPSDKQEELIKAVFGDGGGMSRREMLGALAGGSLVGASAYHASTGNARAASNEIGDVGEPGGLVDAYLEDASVVSLDADEVTNTGGQNPIPLLPIGTRSTHGYFDPSLGSDGRFVQPTEGAETGQFSQTVGYLAVSGPIDLTADEWRIPTIGTDRTIWGPCFEEWSTHNQNAIYAPIVQGNTVEFQTKKDDVVNSTDISAQVDPTVEHSMRVEWRPNEPRATLFIDGAQVAEHTTTIPTTSLIPFLEINHTAAVGSPSYSEISPDFFVQG